MLKTRSLLRVRIFWTILVLSSSCPSALVKSFELRRQTAGNPWISRWDKTNNSNGSSRTGAFPQHQQQRQPQLLRMSTPAAASLNVALEQPVFDLFGTTAISRAGPSALLWKRKSGLVSSFRAMFLAAVFFAVSFWVLQLVTSGASDKSTSSSSAGDTSFGDSLATTLQTLRQRIVETVENVFDLSGPEPIAMPFDDADADGWGVCTLRSKERYGATSFYRYVFDLPEPDYVLPMELGETVTLCCIDQNEQAVQAEFYPFAPESRTRPGSFSILVPDPSIAPLVLADDKGKNFIGSFNSWNDVQQGKLVQVLQNELQVGDEIALQPSGESRLQYRGRHEVTDILYIAVGTGIAPVLDQMRAILPEDSSIPSAQSLSVVYVNDASDDFDETAKLLEDEYKKHSDKLTSVDCVVMDYMADPSLNKELNEVIPSFQSGTMAVLAGPSATMKKTIAFLVERRGFPRECICVL